VPVADDERRARWSRIAGLCLLAAGAAWLRWTAWQRTAAIFDDGPVFLYLAEALIDGEFAAALSHPYHPGYPAAIAVVAPFAASLESAAVAVSVTAGSLSVLLLYGFVREAFDESAAWIAALLLAVHPPSVFFTSDVQSEGLYTAFFLASAWATWHALLSARGRAAALAGVLAGLAYLVRPEGIGIAIAGIAGGIWLGLRRSWKRRTAAAWCALFAIGAAAAVAPYVLVLRAETGVWMLTQKKSVAVLAGVGGRAGSPGGAPAASPVRVIPRNGPLPGSEVAELAMAPPRPLARAGAAARELYFAAASALRVEVIGFLAVGLIVIRGRPGRRALFIGVSIALYAAVLLALGATSGYVSRRHALPPLLLLFGYLAVGLRRVGSTVARRMLSRSSPSDVKVERLGAVLGVVFIACLFLPRDLAHRRTDRAAERSAAEWLREQRDVVPPGPPGSPGPPGPVAARRIREAYYAGAGFVPIPVRGYPPEALLRYLTDRSVRYVVIDDGRIDDHEGLRGAWELGMRRVHHVELGGREASVLEIVGSAPQTEAADRAR